MKNWIKQLDGLLRGEATKLSALKQGTIEIPAGGMAALIILLGLVYGVCMGSFALFKEGPASWSQFFAATVKVPALFFLTLLVTLPSLYVFNALVGSRLNLIAVWRLLIAALAVNLAVLASFGPIVAFFSDQLLVHGAAQRGDVCRFRHPGFAVLVSNVASPEPDPKSVPTGNQPATTPT